MNSDNNKRCTKTQRRRRQRQNLRLFRQLNCDIKDNFSMEPKSDEGTKSDEETKKTAKRSTSDKERRNRKRRAEAMAPTATATSTDDSVRLKQSARSMDVQCQQGAKMGAFSASQWLSDLHYQETAYYMGMTKHLQQQQQQQQTVYVPQNNEAPAFKTMKLEQFLSA